jgi:hypothetical protein
MRSSESTEPISPDEFVDRLKKLVAAQVVGSNQLLARFSDFVREASKAVSGDATQERAGAAVSVARFQPHFLLGRDFKWFCAPE